MSKKSIMVNLGDEKAKQIGEVIGNKTCNKILDYLGDNEGTVSDISTKLKIPINTIDYNVKKLVKAGLIEKSSHFWSVKGKKMLSYRISNKRIIISPKKSVGRIFSWVVGLTGLVALTIREFMEMARDRSSQVIEEAVLGRTSDLAAVVPEMKAVTMNTGTAEMVTGVVADPGFWSSLGPWSWFLIGAWFAVFLFFVFNIVSGRRDRL